MGGKKKQAAKPKVKQTGQLGKKSKKRAKLKPKHVMSGSMPANRQVPIAVSYEIPETDLHSYAVADGIGFRGCENLGHFAVGNQPAGTLSLVKELSVNPLNPILFPRTNMLSRVFEQYSFKKLRFFYVPRASTTDTTSILMYFDYDPADPAATTDLQILSNMTRTTRAVWQSCGIDVDIAEMHRNRQSFFTQSPDVGGTDAAAIRQDYCGTWRCYAQTSGTSEGITVNHGYLFVEYDLQLYVPRPPQEVLLTAFPKPTGPNGTGVLAIPSNTSQAIALPYKQQQVGMIGGPHENGNIAPLLSNAWGSIKGVYDAAKQVYGAGEWLFSLVTSAAAAVSDEKSVDGWYELKSSSIKSTIDESYLVDFSEDDPETLTREGRVRLFERAKRRAGLNVGAAGGFSVSLQVWDLNGAAVPADWPLTNNPAAVGMINTGTTTWTYVGTGALSRIGGQRRPIIPAGSQYVIRWIFDTDPAAGSARDVGPVVVTTSRVPATAPLG